MLGCAEDRKVELVHIQLGRPMQDDSVRYSMIIPASVPQYQLVPHLGDVRD
jgi:hypothetical protein